MYEENVVMLAFSVYIELCIAEVYIKVLYVFQALIGHTGHLSVDLWVYLSQTAPRYLILETIWLKGF